MSEVRKRLIMHVTQVHDGGVARYINLVIRKLDKRKFENVLVVPNSYDYSGIYEDVYAVEHIEMAREINFFSDIKSVIALRRIIRKYKPEILYLHSSKAGAIGRIADIGYKNVSIYNAHGWAFNMECSKKKKKLYVFIEKLLAIFCTQIIAISQYEYNSALLNRICNPHKIHLILNGIDFDELESDIEISKKELNIPEDSFIVGMIGRISKQKAPDIFLRCAQLVKRAIPNAFFIIVGGGDEQENIQMLIQDLGLADCVVLTGWVDNPLSYLRLFDIAMLLSRWEGFGLVLPEYINAAKPIVATNVDAIPEIIHDGETGILVDRDDYVAAANAVVMLSHDAGYCQYLVRNGNKIKDLFNVDRMIKETESLFSDLLHE